MTLSGWYSYAEYLTDLILLARGISEVGIGREMKKGLIKPVLKGIWEGMREFREEIWEIGFLYASLVDMGVSYDDAGVRVEAAESYEEALEVRPDLGEAWSVILSICFAYGLNPSKILSDLYNLLGDSLLLMYPVLTSMLDDESLSYLKHVIKRHLTFLHRLGLTDLSPLLDQLREELGIDTSRICESLRRLAENPRVLLLHVDEHSG